MATNVTKAVGSDYRGLAIPSPVWQHTAFSPLDSNVSQANPRPGVPVASTPTGMVLEASGSMPSVAGRQPSLVLTTQKGGMPGIADARFRFKPNMGIPAIYQTDIGWDAPNAISREEVVRSVPGGGQ